MDHTVPGPAAKPNPDARIVTYGNAAMRLQAEWLRA